MRTPNPEELAAVQRVATQRRLARRLLIDLIVFVLLILPINIFEFVIEPFQRGFFCDDETIRYPFLPNTVTPVMLGLLAGTLPLFVFIVVEFVRFQRSGETGATVQFFAWRAPTWIVELAKQLSYFGFGMLLTFDATEVGKYTIGRLRPHFMAVCQPQLSDDSSCTDPQNQHRYIENYVCTGEGYTSADVRQARLSFPSGHSSIAFFAMVYMALYVQRKISWRGSKLARHALQFLFIMLAWYTALSRVMDNWHHWSDVLVGSIIGVACALITARYIAKFFELSYRLQLDSGTGTLQRQDTSATLQEVCSSTPPPYCVNNFSDEQFCTKV